MPPRYRALLIACDKFISLADMTPSGQNNLSMMERILSLDTREYEIHKEYGAITSLSALEACIQAAFGDASEQDVSLLYFSTHGQFEHSFNNPEGQLLLSDGVVEEKVSAQQLNAMLDKISGTKVLLVDACNSGALIGKGVSPDVGSARVARAFQTDDYRVLTSSGASENSWYWTASTDTAPPGSSYFTTALAMGAGWLGVYSADTNRDGVITLAEMYDHLWVNQASSVVQIMPQGDDFPLIVYDSPMSGNNEYGVLTGFAFQSTALDAARPRLTLSYTVMRTTRVAYLITLFRGGQWAWDESITIAHEVLKPDDVNSQGAILPGRKRVEMDLSEHLPEGWTYAMVHVMTVTDETTANLPMIYASRVLSAKNTSGDPLLSLRVSPNWTRAFKRELEVFIGHSLPCSLTISIADEAGETVKRLAVSHRTRPQALSPGGSLFYWNGFDGDGQPVPPGRYRIEATARVGKETYMSETWVTVN